MKNLLYILAVIFMLSGNAAWICFLLAGFICDE